MYCATHSAMNAAQAGFDTRAGSYERKLQTKAGEVTLNMPKLCKQTFETAIILLRLIHHR